MILVADFSWSFLADHSGELAEGLKRTLEVSALGIVGAFAIGILLGAARAARVPIVSQLAATYVEVIRNTPILVQIFLLFYGLPELFDFHLSPFATAWLAVTVWGGAFNTENFRAGFEAVPLRYREAALALGFRSVPTFFVVTFPVGGRYALPSTINTSVSVLKNTALTTAIGFPELTNTAYSIESVTFRAVEVYSVLAVTYLVVVWTLSAAMRFVESRLAIPGTR
jgi:His/Glu/Gln/Arg/opine family amino acid ABC transporter permease subunit